MDFHFRRAGVSSLWNLQKGPGPWRWRFGRCAEVGREGLTKGAAGHRLCPCKGAAGRPAALFVFAAAKWRYGETRAKARRPVRGPAARLVCCLRRRSAYGSVGMVSGGRGAGVLYSVRLCHGGGRVYPGQKRRQHYYEKPDGLLYRYGGVHPAGLRHHEQRELLFRPYWKAGVSDVHRLLRL